MDWWHRVVLWESGINHGLKYSHASLRVSASNKCLRPKQSIMFSYLWDHAVSIHGYCRVNILVPCNIYTGVLDVSATVFPDVSALNWAKPSEIYIKLHIVIFVHCLSVVYLKYEIHLKIAIYIQQYVSEWWWTDTKMGVFTLFKVKIRIFY